MAVVDNAVIGLPSRGTSALLHIGFSFWFRLFKMFQKNVD